MLQLEFIVSFFVFVEPIYQIIYGQCSYNSGYTCPQRIEILICNREKT